MGVSRGHLRALVGAVLRFQLNGCEAGKSVPSLGDPGCGEQQKACLEALPIRVPKTPLAADVGSRDPGDREPRPSGEKVAAPAAAQPGSGAALGFSALPRGCVGSTSDLPPLLSPLACPARPAGTPLLAAGRARGPSWPAAVNDGREPHTRPQQRLPPAPVKVVCGREGSVRGGHSGSWHEGCRTG